MADRLESADLNGSGNLAPWDRHASHQYFGSHRESLLLKGLAYLAPSQLGTVSALVTIHLRPAAA